jgi:O-antigen/teichoic acid export membrane protein
MFGKGGSVFRRNVSWQIVGSASTALLSGLVLLVAGRELAATGFGEYSIIIGFITVANLLMEPRMQDVVARQFWNLGPQSPDRAAFAHQFVDFVVFESLVKLFPALAVALLSYQLANFANLPPDAVGLITIAAVGNYFAKIGYGASTGVLRVLGRSDQFTLFGSGELLLRLLCMVALAAASLLTVETAVWIISVTLALANIAQLVAAGRHLGGLSGAFRGWRVSSMFSRLRDHRRLLFSNIGLSASDLMNKDLDVTLLSSLMPASVIGVYKMAKNIALLSWRAVDPFYLALMPELSRRVQGHDAKGTWSLLRRSTLGLTVLAAGLSVSAFLGVWLAGEWLLGPDFAGIPGIIVWMLFGVMLSAPLVWGHPLAVALNRADLAFWGSLLGLIVGLGAFFVLVALLGIHGAAMAWSLSFLPSFLFTALTARRLLRQRFDSAATVVS